MSLDGNRQPDASLEAYLDGRMDAPAKSAFECRLIEDAELRAAVDTQRAVDRAVCRLNEPPSADAAMKRLMESPTQAGGITRLAVPHTLSRLPVSENTAAAANSNGHDRRRNGHPPGQTAKKSAADPGSPVKKREDRSASRRARWLAAALLLLTVVSAWATYHYAYAGSSHPLLVEYRAREKAGWVDDYHCDDMRHFAVLYHNRADQGMMLANAAPGVEPLGICLATTMQSSIPYLIGDVEGDHAAVFVFRADHDRMASEQASLPARMHLFKKPLGPLMLYELTPRSEPALMPLFELADVPPEWLKSGGYDDCRKATP